MNDKYFIDTNIFVYSFDDRDPAKKARAVSLIAEALESGNGTISTQVIQEFLNVATQKFHKPLKVDDSLAYLRKVLNPLCHITPDLALYETGLQVLAETRYSFYDSLVIAAAIRGDCAVLYSEDLQDGQTIHNVRITNPFTGI
jgi:predicted nucleic acid-binding protein